MGSHHLVLIGLLYLTQLTASAGYYTVLAPRVLRPNSEYHVAVSSLVGSLSTTVTVAVEQRNNKDMLFRISQSVAVEPYSTNVVKLKIPDLKGGTYYLTAEETHGPSKIEQLYYLHKNHSVFIQTDKAMYEPGQKIQFRAIALDADFKPSDTGTLDIFISDGKNNNVKQWTKVQTTKGVFTGDLQLSEFALVGNWNIMVSVMKQTFHKTFEVAEYILPKFEVTIEAPRYATFNESHIVSTVNAKYTNGKAVEGKATVTIFVYLLEKVITPVSKTVPINGEVAVEFDIAKDLKLDDKNPRLVQVNVSVEETLTGRIQYTSCFINLYKYKYRINKIKTSEFFKPGLNYKVFLKITSYDGSPVQDQTNPVNVKYGYTYDENLYVEENHTLSEDGIIELNFSPTTHSSETGVEIKVLGIKVKYLDLEDWHSLVTSALSPSYNFIQATLVTENPTVNQDIEIDINCTEPIKYLNYKVFARGNLVAANTVQVNNKKTYRLKILTTYDMVPASHITVYYVRDDGEIVADIIHIVLDGMLQNFVNININPTEAEPGSKIEITIETKPNSFVGLLAVDQSALLLKSGNDITEEIVTKEFSVYDIDSDAPNFREKEPSYWWPDHAYAKHVFQNYGAVILTNGMVFDFSSHHYESPPKEKEEEKARSSDSAVKGLTTRTKRAADPDRIRNDLPETWLWQMLKTGEDGKLTIQETIPDTITSWIITGFSVDPLYGLGLSKSPVKLTVFRPFFISLDLPYSVHQGKAVVIPIVVFNYMTNDVVADTTLKREQLEDFEFTEISNDVNEQSKQVTGKANSGSSLSFKIIPKKLGQVTIKVTATSTSASDSIVKNLLVEPAEVRYLLL